MCPLRVDLVVPVQNEGEAFRRFYDGIVRHVRSDWRMLVVYDVPQDTTLTSVKPIVSKDPRIVLVRNEAVGVLEAIKTGFKRAESEAVCVVMVDDPPGVLRKIDKLLETFTRERASVVAASRYMQGGTHAGGPLIKGLLSRLAGASLHWLIRLPTHDATYNTRLYRKSFLDRMVIESRHGFEIALEITIKAHLAGATIREVPVQWEERTTGTSKFHLLLWLPAYLSWYWYGIKNYYGTKRRKKSSNA